MEQWHCHGVGSCEDPKTPDSRRHSETSWNSYQDLTVPRLTFRWSRSNRIGSIRWRPTAAGAARSGGSRPSERPLTSTSACDVLQPCRMSLAMTRVADVLWLLARRRPPFRYWLSASFSALRALNNTRATDRWRYVRWCAGSCPHGPSGLSLQICRSPRR